MSTKTNDQENVPMDTMPKSDQSQIAIPTTKKIERANWSNRIVYLLSIIGFVVDLGRDIVFFFSDIQRSLSFFSLQGNVWRFPTTCYRNGGGAFLIPYFTFLFLVGLPCKLIFNYKNLSYKSIFLF